jgi:hypothetical protein
MPGKHERHAASRWEWGTQPARSTELREAVGDDPHPSRRPPGRKDKRHWCRGKPGREHVPELAINQSGIYWGRQCGWKPSWNVTGQDYDVTWWCRHREVCANCGKILREAWDVEITECPLYPGSLAQLMAAREQLKDLRIQRAGRKTWRRKPAPDGPSHYRRPRKTN